MAEAPTRRALMQSGVLVVSGLAFAGCRRRGTQWPDPPPFLTPQDRFYNRLQAKLADGKFEDRADVPKDPEPPDPATWTLTFKGFDREQTLDAAGLAALATRFAPVSYVKTLRCTATAAATACRAPRCGPASRSWPCCPSWASPRPRDACGCARTTASAATCSPASPTAWTAARRCWPPTPTGSRCCPRAAAPAGCSSPTASASRTSSGPTEILASPQDEAWGDHEVDRKEGEDDGHISFVSKILSPDVIYKQEVQEGRAGPVTLQGVACGGLAPIRDIRLRVNGGAWQPVTMIRPAALDSPVVQQAPGLVFSEWPMPDVAVPWKATLDLPVGTSKVEVMSTNTLGEEQPETDTWRTNGDSAWAWVELKLS